MATYDALLNSQQFVSDAAATLRALGEDVSDNPQEVVDDVLTEYRWGGLGTSDTPVNVFSALQHREKLSNLDKDNSRFASYKNSVLIFEFGLIFFFK